MSQQHARPWHHVITRSLFALFQTELPKRKLIPICILLFCESFNSTSVFSYVAFMVLDLKKGIPTSKVGFYAGAIASVWYLAQFCSSYLWGRASDKVGRRPILLCGAVGSLVSSLAFGFSFNYPLAIVFRSLNGLLNGNIGVIKTYLAEITTSSTQAKAFGLVGLMWGIGSITGSVIGGLTARLAVKYPQVFSPDGFFGQFPYATPNLISSAITLTGLILAYKYLTENVIPQAIPLKEIEALNINTPEHSTESEELSNGDTDKVHITLEDKEDTKDTKGKELELLKEENPTKISKISQIWHDFWTTLTNIFARRPKGNYSGLSQSTHSRTEKSIFKQREVWRVCILYSILGFTYTIHDEDFPLWSMTDASIGGLNFTTNQIGFTNGITGLAVILIQLFIYHRVATKLGLIATFRHGCIWALLTFLLIPWTNIYANNIYVVWVLMTVFAISKAVAGQLAFSSVMAMIANSVDFKQMGSVNGLAQSMVACTRAVAPTLGGVLFAWSVALHKFYPLNQHFVFLLMAILSAITALLTIGMPLSINKPKNETVEENNLMTPEVVNGNDIDTPTMERIEKLNNDT